MFVRGCQRYLSGKFGISVGIVAAVAASFLCTCSKRKWRYREDHRSFRLVCADHPRVAIWIDDIAAAVIPEHLAWARKRAHHECMQTVFEAAGGNDGLRGLAYAWHKRVMADEVVAHAFSHGLHPQHVDRLAAYWAEALGGPTTYSDSYGDETTVVKMHSGNGKHDEMDRRAIACFDLALADVGLADDDVLRQVLHDYFAWATTTTMARYHQSADDVPNGLSIPHWSWDGLQD